jgi:hypothetical protein
MARDEAMAPEQEANALAIAAGSRGGGKAPVLHRRRGGLQGKDAAVSMAKTMCCRRKRACGKKKRKIKLYPLMRLVLHGRKFPLAGSDFVECNLTS